MANIFQTIGKKLQAWNSRNQETYRSRQLENVQREQQRRSVYRARQQDTTSKLQVPGTPQGRLNPIITRGLKDFAAGYLANTPNPLLQKQAERFKPDTTSKAYTGGSGFGKFVSDASKPMREALGENQYGKPLYMVQAQLMEDRKRATDPAEKDKITQEIARIRRTEADAAFSLPLIGELRMFGGAAGEFIKALAKSPNPQANLVRKVISGTKEEIDALAGRIAGLTKPGEVAKEIFKEAFNPQTTTRLTNSGNILGRDILQNSYLERGQQAAREAAEQIKSKRIGASAQKDWEENYVPKFNQLQTVKTKLQQNLEQTPPQAQAPIRQTLARIEQAETKMEQTYLERWEPSRVSVKTDDLGNASITPKNVPTNPDQSLTRQIRSMATKANKDMDWAYRKMKEAGNNAYRQAASSIENLSQKELRRVDRANRAVNRMAFKSGITKGQQVLQERIDRGAFKALMKVHREVGGVVTKQTTGRLVKEFRAQKQGLDDMRTAALRFAKQALPRHLVGRFTGAITNVKTEDGLNKIAANMNKAADEFLSQSNRLNVNKAVKKVVKAKEPKVDVVTLRKLEDLREKYKDGKLLKSMTLKEQEALKQEVLTMIKEGKEKLIKQKEAYARKLEDTVTKIASETKQSYGGGTTKAGKEKYTLRDHVMAFKLQNSYANTVLESLSKESGYRGELIRLDSELNNANSVAILRGVGAKQELYEYIAQTTKHLSEDDMSKIILVKQAESGATEESVKATLEHLGLKELPTLSPAHRAIGDKMQEIAGRTTEEFGAVAERMTGEPFRQLPNYFVQLRYKNVADDPFHGHPPAWQKNLAIKKTTEAREEGVNKVLRTDMGVWEDFVDERYRYIELQEQLKFMHDITDDPRWVSKAGYNTYVWMKDRLGDIARGGPVDMDPLSKTSRWLGNNTTLALITYKLTSILNQPFAVFNAGAVAHSIGGPKALVGTVTEMMGTWLNPFYANRIVKGSNALSTRSNAGEMAITELKNRMDKNLTGTFASRFTNLGLKGITKTDLATAAGARQAILNMLKKTRPDANHEVMADYIMNASQISTDLINRPSVMRSSPKGGGELGKSLYRLGSFNLGQWQALVSLATKVKTGKGLVNKMNALFAVYLMGAGAVALSVARENVREEMKKAQAAVFGGEYKAPDKGSTPSAVNRFFLSYLHMVPIVGAWFQSFEYTRDGDFNIPVVDQIAKIFRGTRNAFNPESSDSTVGKGFVDLFTGLATLLGVAGSSQVGQMIRDSIPDSAPAKGKGGKKGKKGK